MYYVGLKGGVGVRAVGGVRTGWAERAVERTLRIVEEIRGGRIAWRPPDRRQLPLLRCEGHLPVETRPARRVAEGA